ncbi:transcription-repair coupling factor [Weeksellaceae bacterium KMM 9713]|uniref:Transcription-repair-coupling factor n=1 Tax=Profundicola chukchiensis TaxID=2961959 RepID=A0A9X4N1G3_9FLAO|nr:transcription-repair coupling factor [Profundicola chukchiensis]MDG4946976.1 transcription-repair coupling factor [Profundicola chukchiensis]
MNITTLKEIKSLHKSADFVQKTIAFHQENAEGSLQIKGLIGSSKSFTIANLFEEIKQSILVIYDDPEEASYALNELEEIYDKNTVLYFPPSHRRPYEIEEVNNANVVLRTEVLNKLSSSKKPRIIVSNSNAITEKVVTKATLSNKTQRLKVGEQISVEFLNEVLFDYDFHRVDFVTEPGEFSVRGGIIDIFSFSDENPYRISFFGDEVDSIRKFDIETQLSIEKVNKITIVANVENKLVFEKRQNFLEFLPKSTCIVGTNLILTAKHLEDTFSKAKDAFEGLSQDIQRSEPEELFTTETELKKELEARFVVELSNQTLLTPHYTYESNQTPQPPFHKKFDLLIDDLQEKSEDGYTNYIFCSGEKQVQRFKDIFEDIGREVKFNPIISTIHSGFVDNELKITCYTDHQIFERYHKYNLRNSFSKKESITLKELTGLQVGDYVTHIDHGVGKFGGLKRIDVNGTMQEAIKLIYRDNDILYVSIHSLHKVAKFSGKDGKEPTINKLGSPAWKNLKNKTKKKVKEVAFDLIKLYAKRKMEKGFQFSEDGYMQNELEASFMYEDTPDQLKATEDVKADMESPLVMDRLICGDVGFGKTEVAIRAAFKAATDGKQVAVLVPTTILAFQHWRSFKERLADFPVRIEYLNRFKTAKQKTEILKDLADGKIEIIIGTHQIVSQKVKFKDLGLLIVDEEHKFGVSVKDKLKTLRAHLDTITLTATPIPRTLQFSLMAARDLSIIKTPPPNRQPVETKLIGLNEEVIRDAVFYELQRGGQVFIIFNRIAGLKDIAGMVQRLVPEAKIGIGHGQMDGKKLEKTMLDFMAGKFDVLVSTTIVESGVDVPNANTMIIVDAQNFGLADIHQMRGRVGRSNRKAFCYLITPPLVTLTSESRKRLQAIEQYSDLGSGFNIAMKDLEIRGAGNLLGAEQSGFMAEMGFETYQKILNEAIEELKYSPDFKELFEDEPEKDHYVSDFNLDSDLELLLPYDYVNSVEERMSLYQEITQIENEEQLESFRQTLIDRFGDLPTEAVELLKSIELKWLAQKLGLEKIIMKGKILSGYFINNTQSPFYQGEQFQHIIQYLAQNPNFASLKERTVRGSDLPSLILKIKDVSSVDEALEVLSRLKK